MDVEALLQRALQSLQSGAPAECLAVCEDILRINPGVIQALYLRGCAAFETGDFDRSVADLEVVHHNHPTHMDGAFNLGRAFRAAGKAREALAPLEVSLADDGLALRAHYELAVCLTLLRRRPEAVEHYEAILAAQPHNAQVAANLAALLERENRLDEARRWTTQALELEPQNELAQMTLAILERRSGNDAQAANTLWSLLPAIEIPVNQSIAWNQLGQCREGLEEWDKAFDAFSTANRILRENHVAARPDPRGPHGLETLGRIRKWLAGKPLAEWHAADVEDAGGIVFLVGFPRSGTTLLDRMLGSHPDIEVLEEKSLFAPLHQDWAAPGTLEALADANAAQIADARALYHEQMSRHRTLPDRPIVVDKLPLNLAYLFLIQRLFPGAPILFLQRHPLDACLSCYFQAFALEASMAYFLDLKDTVRYYDAVMQVATLSLEQTTNPVHALHYEDLVTSPKEQLAALLEFLALEWNDSILDYQDAGDSATSSTPSYQQVSLPLYTRSIGRWQHYAKQTAADFSSLAPWVKHFGYE